MAFLIGAGKLRLYCGVTTTMASDSKTVAGPGLGVRLGVVAVLGHVLLVEERQGHRSTSSTSHSAAGAWAATHSATLGPMRPGRVLDTTITKLIHDSTNSGRSGSIPDAGTGLLTSPRLLLPLLHLRLVAMPLRVTRLLAHAVDDLAEDAPVAVVVGLDQLERPHPR